MYCEKCGSEIKEGSKFCPKCGAPIPLTDPRQKVQDIRENGLGSSNQANSPSSDDINQPTQKSKPRWRLFLIIAIVVVAAAIIAIVFGVRSSRAIDLNKYVTVEFEGYEGYGTANVSVDWNSLREKYDKRITLRQLGWEGSYYSFSGLLEDCVYWTVEPESNLSNGDEVTLNWDVDTMDIDAAVENTVRISAEPKTYKVSNLEEVDTFDAFEGIGVEFSGVSPIAKAALEKNEDVADQLVYTLDPTTGLAIGDTVTVTIDEESAMAYVQECGMLPETLSKSYSVENVAYYVSSLDQIPEDAMEKMEQQAEDEFHAFVQQHWELATLTSFDYLGSYFLYSKTGYRANMSMEYLIYRYQANQNGETVTGYWYCGFENGMILEDGTFSLDYNECHVPAYSSNFLLGTTGEYFQYTDASDTTATYIGYSDLETMFNYLVTANVDEYTYESTVEGSETAGSEETGIKDEDTKDEDTKDEDRKDENTEDENNTENAAAASEKITGISASATSYLPEDDEGHTYVPANLFDGSRSTAYVEDAEGVGEGEELTISLGGEYVIDKIVWSPGYQKSEDILAKNGYPTKLTFYFSDGSSVVSTVTSAPNIGTTETVSVDGEVITDSIRVVIEEAVAGYKYDDTCISEIEIYGHEAS